MGASLRPPRAPARSVSFHRPISSSRISQAPSAPMINRSRSRLLASFCDIAYIFVFLTQLSMILLTVLLQPAVFNPQRPLQLFRHPRTSAPPDYSLSFCVVN
mmetsp:Transcript_20125/g.64447  ORF Transcript_20125/g.64447 Transcript_20125/m.64447 type:complete len:102 (-) Transcript_20125:49-354(-)